MAWVTPPVFVSGNVLTATQLNTLGGDLLLSPAAMATETGQLFAATGANNLAARMPQALYLFPGDETTTSTSYGDLATVGPQITATTGTTALCWMQCETTISVTTSTSKTAIAVSGATTIAAPAMSIFCDHGQLFSPGLTQGFYVNNAAVLITGLTPGSNIFTMKYALGATAATVTVRHRYLVVIPL